MTIGGDTRSRRVDAHADYPCCACIGLSRTGAGGNLRPRERARGEKVSPLMIATLCASALRHPMLTLRSAGTRPLLPVTLGTPPELVEGRTAHSCADRLFEKPATPYECLRAEFEDLFGLSSSEGAPMNMFKRTQALAPLRKAPYIACDKTGARIESVNAYHWAFCYKEAVVHSAAFTGDALVVHDAPGGHRPAVWTSDHRSDDSY